MKVTEREAMHMRTFYRIVVGISLAILVIAMVVKFFG